MSVKPEEHAQERLLKIGDIANITGLTLRTLRYYEEMRLIEPDKRTKGNFRLYGDKVLNKLNFIDSLKRLDFSLNEIRDLLGPSDAILTDQAIIDRTKKALAVKKHKIEERLKELQLMKEDVEHSMRFIEDCIGCKVENPKPCDPSCEKKHYHLD